MRTIPFEEEIAITNSKRANFINEEIHDLYGIHLVTCPKCGTINSYQCIDAGDYTCKHCHTTDEQCHFPDLFY